MVYFLMVFTKIGLMCIILHAVGNLGCNRDNCGYVKMCFAVMTSVTVMFGDCENVLTSNFKEFAVNSRERQRTKPSLNYL